MIRVVCDRRIFRQFRQVFARSDLTFIYFFAVFMLPYVCTKKDFHMFQPIV